MKNSTDAYSSTSVRVFFTFFYGFLSIGGVIGNILVVLVITRVQNMLTPTNCYLISLAISDCAFFVTAVTVELAYLHLPARIYPFSIIGCRLLTYLPYLAINTSSLSITAFTIERYIGICHPLKARFLCTVRRALFIIICIWIFSVIYNSPWLFLATLKPLKYSDLNASTCTFTIERQSWSYKIIFLADFLLFYLLPLLLYLFLYGRIAFTLTMVKFDRPKSDKSTLKELHLRRQITFVSGHQSMQRHQAVKMLIVVVFIFAVSWLPYRALVLYNSFASKPWSSIEYIYFAKIMIFINCSINPFLYNLMSTRFRKAFSSLLKHGCSGKANFEEFTTLIKSPSSPYNTKSVLRNTDSQQKRRRFSVQPDNCHKAKQKQQPRRTRTCSAGTILENCDQDSKKELDSILEQPRSRCIKSVDITNFLKIIEETPSTEV